MICPERNVCPDGNPTLCQVRPAAGGAVLFLSEPVASCARRIPFGDGQICTCPVRKQIFDDLGI